MNTETRRVMTFIIAGLVTAAAVGVSVWRLSTPQSPSASDIAMSTTLHTTQTEQPGGVSHSTQATSGNHSTQSTTTQRRSNSQTQAMGQQAAEALADDPFLAPNAYLGAPNSQPEPTRFYRPDNISEAPGSAEPGEADLPAADTPEPAEPQVQENQPAPRDPKPGFPTFDLPFLPDPWVPNIGGGDDDRDEGREPETTRPTRPSGGDTPTPVPTPTPDEVTPETPEPDEDPEPTGDSEPTGTPDADASEEPTTTSPQEDGANRDNGAGETPGDTQTQAPEASATASEPAPTN